MFTMHMIAMSRYIYVYNAQMVTICRYIFVYICRYLYVYIVQCICDDQMKVQVQVPVQVHRW